METNNTQIIDEEFVAKRIEYMKSIPDGIKTGFVDLDYQWVGLRPGNTYLVAARPAMGKTAFMLNIARNLAVEENKKVAIFSLNQTKEQLVNKLFAIEAEVEIYHLRTGNVKEDEWERIFNASQVIGNCNLIINDSMGISVEALVAELSKEKMSDVQVVFIDYLQLMSSEKEYHDRKKELSFISERLKDIADKNQVAIVVMSQLSKLCEEREDHRPILEDLNENGSLISFDQISFIYRDEYYNPNSEWNGVVEIVTARSRLFGNGTVRLRWKSEYLKFCDVEDENGD